MTESPQRTETKRIDNSNPQITLNNTGASSIFLLNGCIQGTDALGQRVGRKIVVSRIRIRATVQYSAANLGTSTGLVGQSDLVRFVLVYDKQTNQAAVATSSILSLTGNFNAPLSVYNINTQDRFIILGDSMKFVCNAGPSMAELIWDVPCKLEVRYTSGNVGDITDIITGAILLTAVDTNTTGNLPGVWSFYSSVEFQDA